MPGRNNNRSRHLTPSGKWAGFSILVIVVTLGLQSCEPDIEKIKEVTAVSTDPIESSFNTEIVYSEFGKNQMKVAAPRLDQYIIDDKVKLEMPEGITIFFYDSLQEEKSRLDANYGEFYEDQEKMIVKDDVVFVNEAGETLNTEELVWQQDSALIYTDKRVKITREDGIIYGKGLNATEDFSKYTIRKITGELYIDNPDTASAQ